jgi:hypothetical protein
VLFAYQGTRLIVASENGTVWLSHLDRLKGWETHGGVPATIDIFGN